MFVILCFEILASSLSTQTKKIGLTSSAKIEKFDDKRSADVDSTLPSQLKCLPRQILIVVLQLHNQVHFSLIPPKSTDKIQKHYVLFNV